MNENSYDWPRVGTKSDLIESIALAGADEVIRILIPAHKAPRETVSWQSIASAADIAIDAGTLWTDIVPNGELDQSYSMRWGCVPPGVVDGLRAALERFTTIGQLDLVGWGGYLEEEDWITWGATPIPADYGRTRWHDGDHLLLRNRTWDSIEFFAQNAREDFPLAVIPESREFLIARPRYADSLFVSGPLGLGDSLAESDLESFPVDRSQPIPVIPLMD